ncbi:LysR family transcriptional regulator substrate-binding protein [Corynebacterium guangdongense]|uniref:DNA-binding transcriptional LysR family regulator n=1 Tax=Corynebacterium guangdongense TaxID=1783348 RepID=A0ABU1ZXJ4_9CORY|nr:LysR family transcriptional regulator substrate-binding protein [Corynebacterium guangdongense]MDR7328932.1 DNA-binding transcriptional LysR family regulator [Corynebacterium guangdongense]WJZ17505.1 LysR substrate binding domain protein [Corynebacterium guangdongense]
MLTLAFVTGTEPGKWFHRFRQRTEHGGLLTLDSDDALGLVLDGSADLALARLPDARLTEDFHTVRLYEEARGVAVPKDSIFAELGEKVLARDLEGEILNYRIAEDGSIDYGELRAALQVVGANVGIAIAPRPLIRVLSKKQVVALELVDRSVPGTEIALVWRREADSDAIQDFVGIARGRTTNSSRQAAPKRSAREKTLAKQERRGRPNFRIDKSGGKGRRRSR